MFSTLPAGREILAIPCWIYAIVTANTPETYALVVYSSPLIGETDEMFRPVNDYLAGKCYWLPINYYVEDPEMIGGADHRVYSIYPRCPGVDVPHVCAE
ncbi:hypothetical protein ACL02T_08550 [Pseudonocardia sp. RS010]|uniref:hypothetical protein n=1 Tax=Pseudonocardia sp. RS010 TaxID=3385979 RepID=UPI0039A1119A